MLHDQKISAPDRSGSGYGQRCVLAYISLQDWATDPRFDMEIAEIIPHLSFLDTFLPEPTVRPLRSAAETAGDEPCEPCEPGGRWFDPHRCLPFCRFFLRLLRFTNTTKHLFHLQCSKKNKNFFLKNIFRNFYKNYQIFQKTKFCIKTQKIRKFHLKTPLGI